MRGHRYLAPARLSQGGAALCSCTAACVTHLHLAAKRGPVERQVAPCSCLLTVTLLMAPPDLSATYISVTMFWHHFEQKVPSASRELHSMVTFQPCDSVFGLTGSKEVCCTLTPL